MILHTINKPEALSLCLPMLGNDDTVLLIEDGVLLALNNSARSQLGRARVLVLDADVSARGLVGRIGNLESVSYAGFVELAARASKVCSWF